MIRFDLFAASMTLVAAMLIAGFSYREVLRIEHPDEEALQYIPRGKHGYHLEQRGRCVGTATLSVESGDGVTIIYRSTVQTALQQRAPQLSLFVGAFFNSLEQLVRANIDIGMENRKIHIALLNPNPITIEVTTTTEQGETNRTLQVPGPIYLRSNGRESYRVDYQASTAILPVGIPRPSLKTLDWEGFALRELPAGETPECGPDGGAIALDPLYTFLSSQAEVMKTWAGPFVGGL